MLVFIIVVVVVVVVAHAFLKFLVHGTFIPIPGTSPSLYRKSQNRRICFCLFVCFLLLAKFFLKKDRFHFLFLLSYNHILLFLQWTCARSAILTLDALMESVIAEEGTQEMDILARKVNGVLSTRAPFLESPRNFSVPNAKFKVKTSEGPQYVFRDPGFPLFEARDPGF